ncbi:MAG: metallophosphoesterase [Prevotella sp.]|nr:metallophosphoesterase [Prevotella sp.]
MKRFPFVFALLAATLADACLYKDLGNTRMWLLAPLSTVMCTFSFVAILRGFHHNTFMRVLPLATMFFIVPKIIFMVFSFSGTRHIGLLAASSTIIAMGYGYFFGCRNIKVRHVVCKSDILPKDFEDYRILQISDLHLGTSFYGYSFMKKLLKRVEDIHPDLIVFTGDLVNTDVEEAFPFIRYLKKIQAPNGVYSVMGNHDYCEYSIKNTWKRKQTRSTGKEPYAVRGRRVLHYLERKMGWHLLLDEHAIISHKRPGESGKGEIALIGVNNIAKFPFPVYGDLGKATEGLPPGMFKILLSHDPSHWKMGVVHKTDIALTLSGHTHGGQLKLGRFSPIRWMYREWGGIYTEDSQILYVSSGLGGSVPFRLGASPEVNVIKLKRA